MTAIDYPGLGRLIPVPAHPAAGGATPDYWLLLEVGHFATGSSRRWGCFIVIEVNVLLLVIGESVLLLFWEVEFFFFFPDRGRALFVLLLIRRGRPTSSGTQCFHLVPEPPACTSLVPGLGPHFSRKAVPSSWGSVHGRRPGRPDWPWPCGSQALAATAFWPLLRSVGAECTPGRPSRDACRSRCLESAGSYRFLHPSLLPSSSCFLRSL